MEQQQIPLSTLFGAVVQSMQENQSYLNSLDGQDGDAGDNYLHNWTVVEKAVKQAESMDADAGASMMYAARALQRQGKGQTAKMYSSGLARASTQFAGQSGISMTDFLPLLQGLLGGMKGGTDRRAGEGSPMDALLPGILGYLAAKQRGMDDSQALMQALAQAMGATGMAGSVGRQAAPQPGGGLMDILGSLMGGQQGGAPEAAPSPSQRGDDMGSLLGPLLEGLLGGGAAMGQSPYEAPQRPAPRQMPRQAPPPQAGSGDLSLDDLLQGLLGGQQGGSAPQPTPRQGRGAVPYGPGYEPPSQPDPGAAGGTALLEGILRGLLGGGAAPGSGPGGGPEAGTPTRGLGRRGPSSDA